MSGWRCSGRKGCGATNKLAARKCASCNETNSLRTLLFPEDTARRSARIVAAAAVPKAVAPAPPSGRWAKGPPAATPRGEAAAGGESGATDAPRGRAQRARGGRRGAGGTQGGRRRQASPAAADGSESELQLLLRSRTELAKALGPAHAAVTHIDGLIEEARRAKRSALPASAKMRDLEAAVAKKQRARAALATAIDDTRKQQDELAALLASQQESLAALEVEIRALQADVQVAAAAVVVPSPPDDGLGEDESLPPALREARQLARQAHEAAAAAQAALLAAVAAHRRPAPAEARAAEDPAEPPKHQRPPPHRRASPARWRHWPLVYALLALLAMTILWPWSWTSWRPSAPGVQGAAAATGRGRHRAGADAGWPQRRRRRRRRPGSEAAPYRLAMGTVNATSWPSALDLLRREDGCDVDLLLVQEHRLGGDSLDEAVAQALNAGWSGCMAPAVSTLEPAAGEAIDQRHTSGGVAIFARLPVAIGSPLTLADGRALAATAQVPGLGRVRVAVVYLPTGDGVGAVGRSVLQKVALDALAHEAPFVVGGDWNATPEELAASGWPRLADAVVVRPGSPTCFSSGAPSEIDYFACARGLSAAFPAAQVMRDVPVATHRLVRAESRPFSVAETVQIPCRALRLPRDVVVGPHWPPPRWDAGPAAAVAHAQALVARPGRSASTCQGALDGAYAQVWRAMVATVAACTDAAVPPARARAPPTLASRSVPLLRVARRAPRRWQLPSRVARWALNRAQEMAPISEESPGARGSAAARDAAIAALHAPPSFVVEAPGGAELLDTLRRMAAEESASAAFALGLEQLRRAADRERETSSARAVRQWMQWARAAADEHGGRAAFRWSKPPGPQVPPEVGAGAAASALPHHIVEHERRRLAAAWADGDESFGFDDAVFGDLAAALPPLSVDALRRAARSFPRTSASTYDGLHPRHFAMVDDVGLQVVCDLLHLIERLGFWPRVVTGAVTAIIPKGKGGFRGITLLPGVYRLWSRARSGLAKEWEQRHRSAHLSWQSRRGCVDEVLRQAVRAEAASCHGRRPLASGAILVDLASFYDFVQHQVVANKAHSTGFPGPIARLALRMYRGPRAVDYRGFVGEVQRPRRGVAAGCTFASTFVQLLYYEGVAALAQEHPRVHIGIYIDDIALQSHASSSAVLGWQLHAALRDLHGFVVEELGCAIAADKTAVVGNSKAAAQAARGAVRRHLGVRLEATEEAVRNLGVADAGGRARSRARLLRASRVKAKASRARARRLRRLRRAVGARRAHQLAEASLGAALRFGAEVYGWAPSQLRAYHSCLLGSALISQAGSRTISLALLGEQGWRGGGAPIIGLARLLWNSMSSGRPDDISFVGDFARAWRLVDARRPRKWQQVRGPIGAAMVAAANYFGWHYRDPMTFEARDEKVVGFLTHSHALVAAELRRDWRRRQGEDIATKLHLPLPVTTEAAAAALWRSDLPRSQSALGFAFVTRNLWTQRRLADAGYSCDDDFRCSRCRQEEDSIAHRLWRCPATAEERTTTFKAEEIARLDVGGDLADTVGQGLVAIPALPPPGTFASFGSSEGERSAFVTAVANSTHIFVDGSGSQTRHPLGRRAAWGLVAVRRGPERGVQQVLGRARGPVSRDLPQTSGAGELVALATAVQLASAPIRIVSDYASAVRAAGDLQWHLDGRRLLAGIMRSARGDPQWALVRGVDKVKAHQELGGLVGDDLCDAEANGWADAEAKNGVLMHPDVDGRILQEFDMHWELARKVVRFAASALGMWPRLAAGGRSRRRMAGAPPASGAGGTDASVAQAERGDSAAEARPAGHQWSAYGGAWRCAACLRSRRTQPAAGAPPGTCRGACAGLQALLGEDAAPHGHDLIGFESVACEGGAEWLLACSRCGAYASTPAAFATMAGGACPGSMSRGAGCRWRRLLRGKHPVREAAMHQGVPLNPTAPGASQ